jgi:hypothetical protein
MLPAADKERAFMPSTNDANKGALGLLQLMLCSQPMMSMHIYNVLVMFNHNDSQAFMDGIFQPFDHTFIMQEYCWQNSSGLKRKWKAEIREHDERVVAAKQQKKIENELKQAGLQVRIDIDVAKIKAINVNQIDDQLASHKNKHNIKIPVKLCCKVSTLPQASDLTDFANFAAQETGCFAGNPGNIL